MKIARAIAADIVPDFATAMTKIASDLFIASGRDMSPTALRDASVWACDLFDAIRDELAIRVNLEIDRVNEAITKTVGSVAKGGES